ncbi:MAG: hypothetical protein ACK5N9_09615, partial [Pirellula sp.]
ESHLRPRIRNDAYRDVVKPCCGLRTTNPRNRSRQDFGPHASNSSNLLPNRLTIQSNPIGHVAYFYGAHQTQTTVVVLN